MPARKPTPLDEIYRLRLTLRDIEPPIWQLVEVPGRITLVQLHAVIQTVVGWLDYHLHDFRIGDATYGTPDGAFDRDTVDERRRRLRDLVPQVGATFEYAYDFGDGWEVEIVVEAIEAAVRRGSHPRLVAGSRAAPPEDVGGPGGYEHFLEVIADPTHEEHGELLDWVGGEFDPEWLDLDGINEALKFEASGGLR